MGCNPLYPRRHKTYNNGTEKRTGEKLEEKKVAVERGRFSPISCNYQSKYETIRGLYRQPHYGKQQLYKAIRTDCISRKT